MSQQHPIIAVTGSSGAGLSTIRHAFKFIFERQNIKPAIVHGNGFRRYTDRQFAALLEEARVCDAGALPFADASADAVLCRFGFMFFPDVAVAAREFARVARPGARVCAAVWGEPERNPWATSIMGTIARHVDLPAPPPGSPGLFRCAPPGYMRAVFAEAGLRDIAEEEVTCDMVIDTPERYWEFMTDIAAPVVAGLAKADEVARERIRAEVLGLASQFLRKGVVRMPSAGRVVVGTR